MKARIAISILCASLISFAVNAQAQSNVTLPRTGLAAAKALEDALVAAIASAEGSVVAIARGRRRQVAELLNPQFVPHEYATGVVVDRNGLILTNYHALGDVATNDYVVWISGKAYSNVRVKAADPWTDLAVLEIDAEDLKPIALGSAVGLQKGKIVIALGNPHAIARDGHASATWGIISNLSRKVDGPLPGRDGPDRVRMQDRETRYHYGALIQTDARLARGSSGGPLLDLDGRMIGLITTIAALAGFERGAGYAIPVDDTFRRVLNKLKRGEEVEQGFLGVEPQKQEEGLGVVLKKVQPGTPAYQAGLREQDEITRIDDQAIQNIDDLFLQVGSLPPNHVARITFRRGPNERTVPVRLTKKPLNASRPIVATAPTLRWRGMEVDYSTTILLRRNTVLDPLGCVVVKIVEQDSRAWKAGVRPGVLISHVDGQRVARPGDFFAAAQRAPGVVELRTFDLDGRAVILVQ